MSDEKFTDEQLEEVFSVRLQLSHDGSNFIDLKLSADMIAREIAKLAAQNNVELDKAEQLAEVLSLRVKNSFMAAYHQHKDSSS